MRAILNAADRGATPHLARRGFVSGLVTAAAVLPLLPWGRKAGAQTYYDQYASR